MSYPESVSLSGGILPVKNGNLLEFPEDPIACMRQLHREFGDMAVLEDQGQRIGFVFSPELNREVLSNSNTYHSSFSRFEAVVGRLKEQSHPDCSV